MAERPTASYGPKCGVAALTDMTKFFRQLVTAKEDIRSHFLTFAPRVNGRYTRRELSQLDAFAVLVHAEIEAYFEDCANHAIDVADKFLRKDAYNRIIYSLGAFYARAAQEGSSILKVPDKDIWRERGGWAVSAHRQAVKSNNGIKTDDLCRMLIPIGVDVREVDQVLLLELDQFGSVRGLTAHASLRSRRRTVVDPFVRQGEIENLFELLKTFDDLFKSFIGRQAPVKRRARKRIVVRRTRKAR